MYKEASEANDSEIQMEDVGKLSVDQTSSLVLLDYEDEGSRQYLVEKGQTEYRDMNSNEEHTPTGIQPNEYSDVEHHQQKVTIARLSGQPQNFVSMCMLPFLLDNMLGLVQEKKRFYISYIA